MRKGIVCLFFVLAVCTGTAWAQTPDGETPAEETVCDGLEGNLFGLCNAYCEAMDCDSEDPNASERACDRVLENFLDAGGEPPCTAAGSCCEVHDTPGCDDAGCEALICDLDPFCCDVFWDGLCTVNAQDMCGVCGGSEPPPPAEEPPPV